MYRGFQALLVGYLSVVAGIVVLWLVYPWSASYATVPFFIATLIYCMFLLRRRGKNS